MSTPARGRRTRGENLQHPQHELVLLADVDIHRYTNLVGDPTMAAVELDAEQIIDRNYWMSKGASKQLGDLVATGFIAPSDLAMLDTTAEEARDIEAKHGKDALRSLTTVGTPKRARLKSELYRKRRKEEEDAAAAAGGASVRASPPLPPIEERIMNEETKLEQLTPSVAIYYMFMQKAAERRALARKRRRVMASLNKQSEIQEHLALMRGAEPIRKPRKIAKTGQDSDPDGRIQQGEVYVENGVLTAYFFDPNTNKWHKLVGAAQNVFGDPNEERELPQLNIVDEYTKLCDPDDPDEPNNKSLWCRSSDGDRSLNCHPHWYDYLYPTERNFPFCQGLCRYIDGWVAPEGIDGVENILMIFRDSSFEPVATHHVCKSCGVRLCAKCFKLTIDEHRGCLWQMIRMYSNWRHEIYLPWLRKPELPHLQPPIAPYSDKPLGYVDWLNKKQAMPDYVEQNDPEGTIYFDPMIHGKKVGSTPAGDSPRTDAENSETDEEASAAAANRGAGPRAPQSPAVSQLLTPPPTTHKGHGSTRRRYLSKLLSDEDERLTPGESNKRSKITHDAVDLEAQENGEEEHGEDERQRSQDVVASEISTVAPATLMATEKRSQKKKRESKRASKTAPSTIARDKLQSTKPMENEWGTLRPMKSAGMDPTRPFMTLGPYRAITPSEPESSAREELSDIEIVIDPEQDERMLTEQIEKQIQQLEALEALTPQRPSPVISEDLGNRRITRSVSRRLASEEL